MILKVTYREREIFDAVQYDGTNVDEIHEFVIATEGELVEIEGSDSIELYEELVRPGDWIIKSETYGVAAVSEADFKELYVIMEDAG